MWRFVAVVGCDRWSTRGDEGEIHLAGRRKTTMKTGARIAVGVGVGYLLGRTRKGRLALTLAAAGATGRLSTDPAALARQGAKLLGSSAEAKELTGTLRDRLVEAGKAAAVSAASSQVDALSGRIQDRTASLRGRPADADEEADDHEDDAYEEEGEAPNRKPQRRAASTRRRSASEEDASDEDASEEEPEDEPAEERPKRRQASSRRRTKADDTSEEGDEAEEEQPKRRAAPARSRRRTTSGEDAEEAERPRRSSKADASTQRPVRRTRR
jgi:hypothetical protein